MHDAPEVARIANLLADPARARILWTLIDGTTRPAGELAYAANISAQSASAHLAKLVQGGLLAAQVQGRHRYFRVAGAEVAGVIEGMASLGVASRPRTPRAALPSPNVPVQFLHARQDLLRPSGRRDGGQGSRGNAASAMVDAGRARFRLDP